MSEITKYSIIEINRITEFSTLEAAQVYKDTNNLSEEIIEQVVEDTSIPNVSPRQIRQALIMSGVSLQTIEDALLSLPEPMKSLAITEWEYSVQFERNRPLVQGVAQMLGWTSEQLDDLWFFAGTL